MLFSVGDRNAQVGCSQRGDDVLHIVHDTVEGKGRRHQTTRSLPSQQSQQHQTLLLRLSETLLLLLSFPVPTPLSRAMDKLEDFGFGSTTPTPISRHGQGVRHWHHHCRETPEINFAVVGVSHPHSPLFRHGQGTGPVACCPDYSRCCCFRRKWGSSRRFLLPLPPWSRRSRGGTHDEAPWACHRR